MEHEGWTTPWDWKNWESTTWGQKEDSWSTSQQEKKRWVTPVAGERQKGQGDVWGNLDKDLVASTMIYVMQTQKGEQDEDTNYRMDAKQVVDLINFVAAPNGWSTAVTFTMVMLVVLEHHQVEVFQIRAIQ